MAAMVAGGLDGRAGPAAALTPRDVVVYRPPVDNLELISQLIRLGLTSYEARAYGTLVQKGLASSRPGPHAKYAAVAPEVAVERLLAARRAELSAIELDGAAVIE